VKLHQVIETLQAQAVRVNDPVLDFEYCFSSDLMSDVLTLKSGKTLLLTGLYNPQALRAAEIAEIRCVVFVRNKNISEDMISLADELGITILKSPYSMFKTSGILFQNGLKPLY